MNYITTEARPPVLSHVSFTTVDEITVVLPSADLLLTRCHSNGGIVYRVFPDSKNENAGCYEISKTEFNRLRRLLTEAPTFIRPAPEGNVSQRSAEAIEEVQCVRVEDDTLVYDTVKVCGGQEASPATHSVTNPREGRFHG